MTWIIAILLGLILVAMISSNKVAAEKDHAFSLATLNLKKIKLTIITFAIFFTSQNVYATDAPKGYDPAETRCIMGSDSVIDSLLARIEYVDQALPNIPPEEQRFLEAESKAAQNAYVDEVANSDKLFVRSSQMYKSLFARPLYPVWEFRKTIEPARSALKRVLKRQPSPEKGYDWNTYSKNPEAEKLNRGIDAIYAVGNYANGAREFLIKVQGKEFSFLTQAQYERFQGSTYSINLDLEFFLSCKLAKVMGRQNF